METTTITNKPAASRRKFLKQATIAAPVLMTIANKPVLGMTCTISGFVSGNLSRPSQDFCDGLSPGYWKTHPEQYTDESFGTVFGGYWKGSKLPTWPVNILLSEVLQFKGHEDTYEFGSHAVAAYLNSIHRQYSHTPQEIINIVHEVIVTGEYVHETTGEVLTAEDVVDFIVGTFNH